MDYRGKKIAILGFSIEGKSAVDFFINQQAGITVFDEKPKEQFDNLPAGKAGKTIKQFEDKNVRFVFGTLEPLKDFDIIVRSPGIPIRHKVLQNLDPKSKITSVTKLFFDLCPGRIIGVTGTKGKGTTSSLIYEMLSLEKDKVFLGGNIGIVPLDFLDEVTGESFVVLELSSFQLADLTKSPHIAVVLMVTNEHQDHHKSENEYVSAKSNIVKYQKEDDFAVVFADSPNSLNISAQAKSKVFWFSRQKPVKPGCFIKNGYLIWQSGEKKEMIMNVSAINIPGRHNWENAAAAAVVAKLAGVSNENVRQVLKTFKGLPHRLQLIRVVSGVEYYDDSFSTTPETAVAAIESFDRPKILILGGSSKKSDFGSLAKVINHTPSIRAIIGIGQEWARIKEAIKKNSEFRIQNSEYKIIENCKNMEEIVQAAQSEARPGDVVLLSPACASFDMFENYKDRGNQFKKEVMLL